MSHRRRWHCRNLHFFDSEFYSFGRFCRVRISDADRVRSRDSDFWNSSQLRFSRREVRVLQKTFCVCLDCGINPRRFWIRRRFHLVTVRHALAFVNSPPYFVLAAWNFKIRNMMVTRHFSLLPLWTAGSSSYTRYGSEMSSRDRSGNSRMSGILLRAHRRRVFHTIGSGLSTPVINCDYKLTILISQNFIRKQKIGFWGH